MGAAIDGLLSAIRATEDAVAEQRALRAELITTKVKADRTEQAGKLLEGAEYVRCPQCGTNVSGRTTPPGACTLCCSVLTTSDPMSSLELEAVRRELNDRIDQIADSIERRERGLAKSKRELSQLRSEKAALDQSLQRELDRYDSAFVETVRALDREIATLTERLRSLANLQEMPKAINDLEEQAGALQDKIDRIRTDLDEERGRLNQADQNLAAIAARFKSLMIAVGFPGVDDQDEVVIDPKNWRPVILHDTQVWSFWDAGSGGKKTLFNVCFALALQETARQLGLPVPNVLVIDSPTKNISEDENPELVRSLYREIYRLAAVPGDKSTQFLLIDSDLVEPTIDTANFKERHLAGLPDAPSLIPYYIGP